MATEFRKHLSPGERAAAWRLGAYTKFAEAGVMPSQVDSHIMKTAGVAELVAPTGMAKMIATLSLLAGIPLGVAAHVVGQRVQATRAKEEDLLQQTQYYRNAGDQLEQGLAAADAKA